MGSFSKFSGMPDILENIIQRLPTKDMISLAQTSKTMKNVVYISGKKLPKELSNVKRVVVAEYMDPYVRYVDPTKNVETGKKFVNEGNVELIASGLKQGTLPVQLPASGIDVVFKGEYITRGLNRFATIHKNSQAHRREVSLALDAAYRHPLNKDINKNKLWTIRSQTDNYT
jgi:hypothetical protein